jgi:Zn-dependent protease
MSLHEIAHGFVAYKLGDETAKEQGRLTLNPLKHIDPIFSVLMPILMFLTVGVAFGGAKPVPINTRRLKFGEWGFALVALAGPLTNLILAFLGFLLWHFTYGSGLTAFFAIFPQVNLGFFAFNILPIPPLDGSRLLYAIAPDWARRGLEKIEQAGFFVLIAIVFLAGGLLSTVMSSIMTGLLDLFQLVV